MDQAILLKMQFVAAELEKLHGRAFADAFLEDYFQSKIAQAEHRSEDQDEQRVEATAPGFTDV